MKPIVISPPTVLFENKHVRLYSVQAGFEGSNKTYYVADRGVRVGVMLQRDHKVLLVKQYRHLINDYSWELPSGRVGKGETLEQAARRECLEETGFECGRVTKFFAYMLSNDVIDAPAHLYVSSRFKKIKTFDNAEISQIKWVPFAQCLQDIFAGNITCVFTILGLLTYAATRKPDVFLARPRRRK